MLCDKVETSECVNCSTIYIIPSLRRWGHSTTHHFFFVLPQTHRANFGSNHLTIIKPPQMSCITSKTIIASVNHMQWSHEGVGDDKNMDYEHKGVVGYGSYHIQSISKPLMWERTDVSTSSRVCPPRLPRWLPRNNTHPCCCVSLRGMQWNRRRLTTSREDSPRTSPCSCVSLRG